MDLSPYLRPGPVVDADHPAVAALARRLAGADIFGTVQACFAWVRDQVRHTVDAGGGPVTCRASEVLAHRTGYCYAKSHLLAALLRANAVPAGLCYQRLSAGDAGAPYGLHGLVAVWLDGSGWYRIDPRGDRPGIATRFAPPVEHLAYRADGPGEADLPGTHAVPLDCVVAALERAEDWRDLRDHLPDIPPPG